LAKELMILFYIFRLTKEVRGEVLLDFPPWYILLFLEGMPEPFMTPWSLPRFANVRQPLGLPRHSALTKFFSKRLHPTPATSLSSRLLEGTMTLVLVYSALLPIVTAIRNTVSCSRGSRSKMRIDVEEERRESR
jgi:hypothetical protein